MHDKLNIVLLTVDSLRADHLGCYGYERSTSPFMDSFARAGVLAERFITPAIPTQPSYTTLLTGQLPITHNIVSHGGQANISRESPMLPEILAQAGYVTCSVDNLWRHRFWYGRGFEFIIDPSVTKNLLISVTCEELNHRAIPWIQQHAQEPFFLFMHYWDPHYPYAPPDKYRHLFYEGNPIDPDNHSLDEWWDHPLGALAKDTWLRTPQGVVTDADYVSALYDQEIRHLDDGLREIVAAIDEAGLAEQTLIIILGDHGESLTEHGIFFEHYGLYDTVLHVPMIMRLPGVLPAEMRLERMLQHVDIAPTVLEAAGLRVPKAMDGHSFWRMATGQEPAGGYDAVISVENTWQACWSIRTDRYKYILSREPHEDGQVARELYDLHADPHETQNITAAEPNVASALEAQLEGWIAERLQIAKRSKDPLIEQGISLGAMLQGQE